MPNQPNPTNNSKEAKRYNSLPLEATIWHPACGNYYSNLAYIQAGNTCPFCKENPKRIRRSKVNDAI